MALNVRLDGQQFVLTLVDGTEQRVDLSAFITQTEVKSSDTITLAIESGVIVARLASGSVTMAQLNPEVTAYIEAKEQSAAGSAASASVSEQNALNSANSAEQSHQNAKTCQEQACLCATQADLSRKAASTSEQNAKASEQAAKQSETKSAASEANAKESEQKAATSESNASGYEQGALNNAQTAEQAAETAVNAMNNASASEQNAKASETASQTNKEASDTSASSAAESAKAAAESAKRAEEEANRAADNAGGDFATRSELQAHTTAENPHNIDAQKVGLGNVPNVATNDQTPTYEVSDENAELTSGEKLGIAFGKISKAVSSFISHLANKENPHKVTAKQIGAATSVNGIAVDESGKIELHEEELLEILANELKRYFLVDGSRTMTGTEGIYLNSRKSRIQVNDNALWIYNASNSVDSTEKRRGFGIYNRNYSADKATAFRFFDGSAPYYAHGEHNKTTGEYTGNGSSATRVINTGGIGKVLAMYGAKGVVIVTPSGGFYGTGGSGFAHFAHSVAMYEDGVLTLNTANSVLNANGVNYNYKCI